MWTWRTVRYDVTPFNLLPFKNCDLSPFRYKIFDVITISLRNNKPPFSLSFLAKTHGTTSFRKNCSVFRLTCFKQIRHARKPAGDITCLRSLLRDARNHLAHPHFFICLQIENRITREEIMCWDICSGQIYDLTFSINEAYRRAQILTRSRSINWIQHRNIGETS